MSPCETVRAEPEPDDGLVERARRGDLRSFEVLVQRHQAIVARVVGRIVGREHVDDVVQDVFLRAFHRLEQFRGDAPFRSWLLRIAHNTAVTFGERQSAAPVSDPRDLDERLDDATAAPTPAQALELSERRARLATKLRLLSTPHRTVLVLRDLEGLSYEEIAEVTETPLGSVKGRLHRARREFIEILRRNTYDWELPTP